jgi:hypothetical protein
MRIETKNAIKDISSDQPQPLTPLSFVFLIRGGIGNLVFPKAAQCQMLDKHKTGAEIQTRTPRHSILFREYSGVNVCTMNDLSVISVVGGLYLTESGTLPAARTKAPRVVKFMVDVIPQDSISISAFRGTLRIRTAIGPTKLEQGSAVDFALSGLPPFAEAKLIGKTTATFPPWERAIWASQGSLVEGGAPH